MHKKILLTSIIAFGAFGAAYADMTESSTFPQDGVMEVNTKYVGQANYGNMGLYAGSIEADPQYEDIPYSVVAGSYLTGVDANNAATTAQCTSGYYCPGVQSTTYDYQTSQFANNGLQECPEGYSSSDSAATANTQCYRACNIANMDTGEGGSISNIPHAASLSGSDYYGNGTDTCVAATCVDGYHVENGACVGNTITITWNGASAADIAANTAGTCTYGGDIRTPAGPAPQIAGKTFLGWEFNPSTIQAPVEP